jgi:predicted anti-sigma-YlaC factor YlaD
MRLFGQPEMTCREVVELVTEYFEGTLTRRDKRRFDHHLRGCEHCTAYLEQMRITIEAAGHLTAEDLDPQARAALLEAFRDWKRASG